MSVHSKRGCAAIPFYDNCAGTAQPTFREHIPIEQKNTYGAI